MSDTMENLVDGDIGMQDTMPGEAATLPPDNELLAQVNYALLHSAEKVAAIRQRIMLLEGEHFEHHLAIEETQACIDLLKPEVYAEILNGRLTEMRLLERRLTHLYQRAAELQENP